jgi:DNA-binding NarL/FixJ family response regulator
LCVDDSPDIAGLLELAIGGEPDMEIAGCVLETANLLAEVERTKPDVVILDLTMPGRSPLEVLAEMNQTFPGSRTIIYSGYDDPETVDQAVDAGAWGYLSKHQEMSELIEAIRKVASGELVLTGR